jgi:hypothetical protein
MPKKFKLYCVAVKDGNKEVYHHYNKLDHARDAAKGFVKLGVFLSLTNGKNIRICL